MGPLLHHRDHRLCPNYPLYENGEKAVATIQLDPEIPKKAFKIGLISAIGPAMGVFIVMVGLMTVIGGPMAWMRLSIIGAAAT